MNLSLQLQYSVDNLILPMQGRICCSGRGACATGLRVHHLHLDQLRPQPGVLRQHGPVWLYLQAQSVLALGLSDQCLHGSKYVL